MAVDLVKFRRLQAAAEQARADAERAAGVLEARMQELHRLLGTKTLKDAERAVRKLEQEAAAAAKDFEDAIAQFERDWRERIRETKSDVD